MTVESRNTTGIQPGTRRAAHALALSRITPHAVASAPAGYRSTVEIARIRSYGRDARKRQSEAGRAGPSDALRVPRMKTHESKSQAHVNHDVERLTPYVGMDDHRGKRGGLLSNRDRGPLRRPFAHFLRAGAWALYSGFPAGVPPAARRRFFSALLHS